MPRPVSGVNRPSRPSTNWAISPIKDNVTSQIGMNNVEPCMFEMQRLCPDSGGMRRGISSRPTVLPVERKNFLLLIGRVHLSEPVRRAGGRVDDVHTGVV